MFKVIPSDHIFLERACRGLKWIGLRVDDNDPPWLQMVQIFLMLTVVGSFLVFQFIAAAMCKNLSCLVSNLADSLLFVLNLYTYITFLYFYRMGDLLISQLKRIMLDYATEKETLKIDNMLNTLVLWYQVYILCVTTSFNMHSVTHYQECLEKNDSAAYIHTCGKP